MISPIAFKIGPLTVRWYSLAYLFGLLGAWWTAAKLSAKSSSVFTPALISDFVFWAMLGIILGARAGYVLFYNPLVYLNNPVEIFALWHGGMSFHGGFFGLLATMLFFAKVKKISFWSISDIVACVAPLGLMLGRIANFINGELYGRINFDIPWAVEFAAGGGFPRHPSQLYEAFAEGFLPFCVFVALWWFVPAVSKRKGLMSGVFLVWYAVARIFCEMFRQPDIQIGFIGDYFTMGQILSLPLLIAGVIILFFAGKYTNDNSK